MRNDEIIDDLIKHHNELMEKHNQLIIDRRKYYDTQYKPMLAEEPKLYSLHPDFHTESECRNWNLKQDEELDQWIARKCFHEKALCSYDEKITLLRKTLDTLKPIVRNFTALTPQKVTSDVSSHLSLFQQKATQTEAVNTATANPTFSS